MEYGSVETGLMAHTDPAGGYRAFWRSYLLDAVRLGERWRVRVTSLFPRSFPLVRYDIGDEIELPPGSPDVMVGLTRFERVAGRCNDYVLLADGTMVHSEAFTHVVRPCPEVRAYQIVHGAAVRIDYVADAVLSPSAQEGIRTRLARIHPSLADTQLVRVSDLRRTIAGKTRMVIAE
jgi:phenylacetate-CoA ligase